MGCLVVRCSRPLRSCLLAVGRGAAVWLRAQRRVTGSAPSAARIRFGVGRCAAPSLVVPGVVRRPPGALRGCSVPLQLAAAALVRMVACGGRCAPFMPLRRGKGTHAAACGTGQSATGDRSRPVPLRPVKL